MHVDVNGTRLWFDVDGPSLVPDGSTMRARPTLVLVHGGPASYDHSYFKPWFSQVTRYAQVVYLDLRDHGRSARHDPAQWSLEICADDVRAFCDALGIERPIVVGHSMGGMVLALYGARHPGHAAGLAFLGTMGRFDLSRLVDSFRRRGGDEVAELARRAYSVDDVSDEEWARVYAAFGPAVPSPEELARRVRNPDLEGPGGELLLAFDAVAQLGSITSPSLVCVGELDGVTPVACSRELLGALAPGVGRLAVIPGAGHFPWLDQPAAFWPILDAFVAEVSGAQTAATTPP